ncbi:SRPBCC family protein [Streptacidiphilus carbonis]|uniref:SRPBCC family protein n=1 Tax=Streptacidiphilus carbonis TaxID=105422 RepID=UPI0005A95FD4|nr:SRPBCC family protein [Streptacidiphilus carbonis]
MYDTSGRRPDMHWPAGFSPADAHSFQQWQATVPGPAEQAFTRLTDTGNWTRWVPRLDEVSTDTISETFHVVWEGHRFEVFVGEYEPPHRLGWLGIGAGVQLYQAWLLTETGDVTHIVLENIVRGSAPKALDTLAPAWAEKLHALWLTQLAKLSEGGTGAAAPGGA